MSFRWVGCCFALFLYHSAVREMNGKQISSFLKEGFDIRNGSWSIGKGPELLDVTTRDSVRYSNTLGMISMKVLCWGALQGLGQRFCNCSLALPITTPSAAIMRFCTKDPTSSSCHCLPRVKPHPYPLTDSSGMLRS